MSISFGTCCMRAVGARAYSRTGCGAAVPVVLRKGTTDSKVFDEIFVEQAYAPCVSALPDISDQSRWLISAQI